MVEGKNGNQDVYLASAAENEILIPKDIDSCELTCVLLKGDKEIDVETNYVISPAEGGLKNRDFLYSDYMFRTSYGEWNKFAFKIKNIEYR